jgi:hypothetical protein
VPAARLPCPSRKSLHTTRSTAMPIQDETIPILAACQPKPRQSSRLFGQIYHNTWDRSHWPTDITAESTSDFSSSTDSLKTVNLFRPLPSEARQALPSISNSGRLRRRKVFAAVLVHVQPPGAVPRHRGSPCTRLSTVQSLQARHLGESPSKGCCTHPPSQRYGLCLLSHPPGERT